MRVNNSALARWIMNLGDDGGGDSGGGDSGGGGDTGGGYGSADTSAADAASAAAESAAQDAANQAAYDAAQDAANQAAYDAAVSQAAQDAANQAAYDAAVSQAAQDAAALAADTEAANALASQAAVTAITAQESFRASEIAAQNLDAKNAAELSDAMAIAQDAFRKSEIEAQNAAAKNAPGLIATLTDILSFTSLPSTFLGMLAKVGIATALAHGNVALAIGGMLRGAVVGGLTNSAVKGLTDAVAAGSIASVNGGQPEQAVRDVVDNMRPDAFDSLTRTQSDAGQSYTSQPVARQTTIQPIYSAPSQSVTRQPVYTAPVVKRQPAAAVTAYNAQTDSAVINSSNGGATGGGSGFTPNPSSDAPASGPNLAMLAALGVGLLLIAQ